MNDQYNNEVDEMEMDLEKDRKTRSLRRMYRFHKQHRKAKLDRSISLTPMFEQEGRYNKNHFTGRPQRRLKRVPGYAESRGIEASRNAFEEYMCGVNVDDVA